MDISVIIVNWNTRDLLRACLDSLKLGRTGGSSGLDVESIVVDNASSDGSATRVAADYPDVRLIASEDNLGWAKGNNVGIAAAEGRYLLILNPDTEVKPGGLEALTEFMDAHPEAGVAAPQLLNPDGSIQRVLRRFPEPVYLLWDLCGLARRFPRSPTFAAYRMGDFDYRETAEVEQPMGSALFIRRETWEAVGEFDEAFPIFFNDVDWLYRVHRSGWKTFFVPAAEIVHHGGSSTAQVKPVMVTESHRSLEHYYAKHYRGRLPGPVFSAIVAMSRIVERVRIARAARPGGPAIGTPGTKGKGVE